MVGIFGSCLTRILIAGSVQNAVLASIFFQEFKVRCRNSDGNGSLNSGISSLQGDVVPHSHITANIFFLAQQD